MCVCGLYVNDLYYFPAIPCPAGMIYQQCGPLCPQTCDNLDRPCEGGCGEGCFCPVGQVLMNGVCVDDSQCTVTSWYLHSVHLCQHTV